MNRHCFRLVFNRVRRQLMAVRENARSREFGGASGESAPGRPRTAWRIKRLPMALALAGALPMSAHAGLLGNLAAALAPIPAAPGATGTGATGVLPVRADASAPANQRPTILLAPNGVPLVNIQTPSAAGVSRNAYSDFNVGPSGLIFNNSVKDTPTQLGGWVQGNPWLARGAARVILNEVNSSNPSLLYGPAEVAGQGATVIIANPAGIACNGCGFINTPRVTLTTGTAILDANDGSVRGYKVQQGQVLIDGAGLNNQGVSFTDIITRALKVNAAIWAQDVRVVAGAREVGSDDTGLQPGALLADKDRPQVAIDLSILGGIYAKGIRMIGTQSGVGVSNAGKMYAGVGEVLLTSDGRIVNSGAISGAADVTLQAASLDNPQAGEITGTRVTLQVQDGLVNRGLVDGGQTRVEAKTLDNLGTGRLYGDQLAIAADTVNNLSENGTAPVIAARERLDLAAREINNREHAQILSLGDMAIGRTLDAQGHATGQAGSVVNASATIQSSGGMDIKAGKLVNSNSHFSTQDVELPLEQVTEYEGSGSPLRFAPGSPDVYVYNDESDHLHTPEGNFESWNLYRYTRRTTETRVASSDPGKIISGGDMQVDAGSVLNDLSQIIAGGNLAVNAASLSNTEATALRRIVESGIVTNYWRDHKKGRDSTGASEKAYLPAERVETITLTPTVFKQNAGSASAGVQTKLPDNALYRIQPDPSARFLVETDPAFANHRQWLSSDYLLSGLSSDPNAMQKRLGDGYYEQRLIQEQVAQLTGRRFLDGYSSDEAQYQALMDQGLTFAQAQQLKPGIALSAAQMAQLTSDIVWLVEKDVTLPDGSLTRALVPQLYVRVQPGDLQSGGALMAGENVQMNVAGDLTNSGAIAGRKVVALTADNLRNIGGNIQGDAVGLLARQDIDNVGGSVRADSNLQATAGRDINVVSNTRTQSNAQGSVTNVERVAGLYVSGEGGKLAVTAGRDVNLTAAAVSNAGDTTTLSAGRDLNLNTVTEARSQSLAWDSKNTRSDATQSEVGTVIQGKGNVTLQARRDLNARAAQVQSSDGALTLAAGNDINITAGQTRQQVDEAHEHKGTSGALSSTTYKSRDVLDASSAQASNLSGKTVTMVAGHDASITGSNVISDAGTVIAANGNVSIAAAQETRNETHYREEKTSGVTRSGSVAISIGSQKQSVNSTTVSTGAAASTVGSVQGDVAIVAGQNYRQTGSDVLAPQGNSAIVAKDVRIDEARETSRTTEERKFEQSGMTIAVSNPVITAIQTAEQMKQAASNTSDTRMKALAAANVAMVSKTAIDKVKDGQGPIPTGKTTADGKAETRDANLADKVGGIDVSVSLGKTSSQSSAVLQSDQGRGSTIAAGRDVTITASGAGANSNLVIQGSTVRAGGAAALQADNAVQLLASQNTASQQSSSKDSSASVGMSFGAKGVLANATASSARGNADGSDVGYTNTRVEAGESVAIKSGADAVLRGAVVDAPRVVADVGGNMQIESLQDKSHYSSRQQSLGGSISVGAGSVSGSLSAGKAKINSDYAAVGEQSGIKAGDGGFDVIVKGKSTLTGGAITSTQKAVEEGKNRYQADGGTTLTDINNTASYSASSTAVNVGTGFNPEGKLVPSGTSIGVGSDGDQKQSVTRAAISGMAGDKDARTGNAPAALPKIFDAARVQKEITAQTQITQTFGREAPKLAADYAQSQAKAAHDRGDIVEEAKWKEGGIYRVALQSAVGGLAGGSAGAAGAGAAAALAPQIDELQSAIASKLKEAGASDAVAKGAAGVMGNLAAAGVGAVAGAGSATAVAGAVNVDANNRQLHPSEIKWIKNNAKRFAQQQAITEQEAERRLAQQAFREVQFGVAGETDRSAQAFLKNGTQGMLLPGDPSIPGQTAGYMFRADPVQKAATGMYAMQVVSDPNTLAFYGKNGITQPTSEQVQSALDKDTTLRTILTNATLGAAGAAVAATVPPALSWCLANPIACNQIAISGGEIVAGDALGPAGLGVLGTASAVKAVRTADEVNAAMKARGWEPAWASGTAVIETRLPPGTKVNMIVDAKTADAIKKGDPITPGGWATFDNLSSVADDMRQRAAITNQFKPATDGPFYVVEMEITQTVKTNIGFVGKQFDTSGGLLRGGGTQIQFDEAIKGADRNSFLKILSSPVELR